MTTSTSSHFPFPCLGLALIAAMSLVGAYLWPWRKPEPVVTPAPEPAYVRKIDQTVKTGLVLAERKMESAAVKAVEAVVEQFEREPETVAKHQVAPITKPEPTQVIVKIESESAFVVPRTAPGWFWSPKYATFLWGRFRSDGWFERLQVPVDAPPYGAMR